MPKPTAATPAEIARDAKRYSLKPVLREQAEIQQIRDGRKDWKGKKDKFKDADAVRKAFPEFTRGMTQAECEILCESTANCAKRHGGGRG